MPEVVELFVNGRKYGGWKDIRITRAADQIAASFSLGVSDRWAGQLEPWPIYDEDPCRVTIDGTEVTSGYIDRRSHSMDRGAISLSYGGKDKTAALVECDVVLDRWSFKNIGIVDFARMLCEPFGIRVTVQDGIKLPTKPPAKTVINPQDTYFQALEEAGRASGVVFYPDGIGGLVIGQSGTGKVETALVEGVNVERASVDYESSGRHARYVVLSQTPGSDTANGAATRVRAEATDGMVRRGERTRVILPSKNLSAADAKRRADWEARMAAARAEVVSVTVPGWLQPSGQVWPINQIIPVRIPRIGVDGDMLIASVENTASANEGVGRLTDFRLVRPDAFTPEPLATVNRSGSTGWKELKNGAR